MMNTLFNTNHPMNLLNWRLSGALILAILLVACGKEEAAKPSVGSEKSEAAEVQSGKVTKNEKEAEEKEEHEEGKLALSKEVADAAGIKIAALEEQQVTEQLTVTATIGANQDRFAHVAPRVAGRITKVMANLGDNVKAGQSLAAIDSIEVGEAQSAYSQAVSEHALAKAGMDRAEKLFAEQIIPQKDYLSAKAAFEKARAELHAAQDKRQALGIAGGKAAASSRSVFAVAAPFNGTVIEKTAVQGELAEPDKALFSVADLSNVWIDANLFEKDIAKVKVGSKAMITLAAYPGEVFQGKVTYISSVIDKESRTIRARIEAPNPQGRLKLGMFATAAIATGGATKGLMLPEEAVVLIQGQPTAFVQEEGGFEPRAVNLGEKMHGKVLLKSGIKPGEQVVMQGAYALKARMLKSQIGDAD